MADPKMRVFIDGREVEVLCDVRVIVDLEDGGTCDALHYIVTHAGADFDLLASGGLVATASASHDEVVDRVAEYCSDTLAVADTAEGRVRLTGRLTHPEGAPGKESGHGS
jgi:hypothetical protein